LLPAVHSLHIRELQSNFLPMSLEGHRPYML
jgi:hypothetical protein